MPDTLPFLHFLTPLFFNPNSASPRESPHPFRVLIKPLSPLCVLAPAFRQWHVVA